MSKQIDSLNQEQKQKLKEIALARARVMPDNVNMAIGGEMLNRGKIIQHIEQEDEIGQTIMTVEWEFLQQLASRAIYKNE